AVLTFTGTARPWHLLALASVLGVTFAFEVPARQALFADLAGEDLANAVALNSTLVTLMRVVGPSLGGLLVALAGEAWCFAFNAASYLAVLFALLSLKASPPSKRVKAAPVAEGLAFAAKEPRVRTLLLLLVVSSVFGVSYGTLLPVVASQVLGGGPALLGQLLGAAGAGALAGALTLLLREPAALERRVGLGASCLGLGILLLSLSRSTPLSLAALGLAGFGQITQTSGTLTLLQSLTPAALRGRLLGLFGTLFIGTTPYGALAAGSLAARFGAPTVLGVFSALVLVASLAFHLWRTRHPARAPSAPPAFPPQVP
ncbi:MAG: MFS transporter, partial [Myxococcota bacterium]